jgi:hypothetical protein
VRDAPDDRYARIPARLLVDSDPMFTQIQLARGEGFTVGAGGMRALVDAHTHHFTFGESVGLPGCRVPDGGVRWTPTRQPVCLEHWPATPVPTEPAAAFTTVMNWTAARPLEWAGERWGQKDVELRRFLALPGARPRRPARRRRRPDDRRAVPARRGRGRGWTVLDPAACVPTGAPTARSSARRGASSRWPRRRTSRRAPAGSPAARRATSPLGGRSSRRTPAGRATSRPAPACSRSTTSTAPPTRSGGWRATPPRTGRAARRIAEECFDARRVLADMLAHAGA